MYVMRRKETYLAFRDDGMLLGVLRSQDSKLMLKRLIMVLYTQGCRFRVKVRFVGGVLVYRVRVRVCMRVMF